MSKAGQMVTMVIAGVFAAVSISESFANPPPRHMRKRARVNTRREAKADRNRDGVVQPKEAHRARTKNYLENRSEVDHKWEARADRDGNGVVSGAELHKHELYVMDKDRDGKITNVERKNFWIKKKSKVNTEVEKRYDVNHDGWVDGDEAQKLLRDRMILVNTHGRAKVNSAVEAEYDINKDGIIDRNEAVAIKAVLGG